MFSNVCKVVIKVSVQISFIEVVSYVQIKGSCIFLLHVLGLISDNESRLEDASENEPNLFFSTFMMIDFVGEGEEISAKPVGRRCFKSD
jgi:hypothetical protein